MRDYTFYIVASYVVAGVVLSGLVCHAVFCYYRAKKRLNSIEKDVGS